LLLEPVVSAYVKLGIIYFSGDLRYKRGQKRFNCYQEYHHPVCQGRVARQARGQSNILQLADCQGKGFGYGGRR
jgi:hypothetical protein